jgi:hypothetical protein
MYSGEMSGAQWVDSIVGRSQSFRVWMSDSYDFYKKWYDFSYGKSMADIATALSITVQEATDMNAAFIVFKELNDAMNNVLVLADDRKTKLMKFI